MSVPNQKPNPQLQQLKQKLLSYLAVRSRSIAECRLYLAKKGATEQEQLQILDEFEQLKILDDLEFARWFVASRLRSKPRGAPVLYQELKRLGVAKNIINQVLKDIEATDYVAAALKQIHKSAYRYHQMDPDEQRYKIYAQLSRRGFDSRTIATAIDAWTSDK